MCMLVGLHSGKGRMVSKNDWTCPALNLSVHSVVNSPNKVLSLCVGTYFAIGNKHRLLYGPIDNFL